MRKLALRGDKRIRIMGAILCFACLCGCQINPEVAMKKDYDVTLSNAIRLNNVEGIKETLENGADINHTYAKNKLTGYSEVNPYVYADRFEHTINVAYNCLLEQGADVNLMIYSRNVTLLMKYAETGSLKNCKRIVDLGADVSMVDSAGKTAVDHAAEHGASKELIYYFAEQGANITQQTLDLAIKGDRIDLYHDFSYSSEYKNLGTIHAVVQLMLENGDSPDMDPLLLAAATGNSEQVIALCKNQKIDGEMAFHAGYFTTAFCSPEALEACIDSGFPLRQYQDYGQSPLECAAQYGNTATTKWLVEHWEQYYAQDYVWDSPLEQAMKLAVEYDHMDTVAYLLTVLPPLNFTSFDALGSKLISASAENGNIEMIQLLLEHGNTISDDILYTTCERALNFGQEDTFHYLITVNPLSQNSWFEIQSSARDKVWLLELCAEHGIEPTNSFTMVSACESGYTDTVKYMLEHGFDPNFQDDKLGTPFLYAIEYGYYDIVQLMISYGADVNMGDRYGDGAPLRLAGYTSANICTLLIEHGAEIDTQDQDGLSPLMCAAIAQNERTIPVLLNAGANVNLVNAEGKTAADLAKETNNESISDFFQ